MEAGQHPGVHWRVFFTNDSQYRSDNFPHTSALTISGLLAEGCCICLELLLDISLGDGAPSQLKRAGLAGAAGFPLAAQLAQQVHSRQTTGNGYCILLVGGELAELILDLSYGLSDSCLYAARHVELSL